MLEMRREPSGDGNRNGLRRGDSDPETKPRRRRRRAEILFVDGLTEENSAIAAT